MSDEQANIVSPGSSGPGQPAAGGPFRVSDRADILRPETASNVSLITDPARSDVVWARFWGGDHRSYGATARVTETDSKVIVEVLVGTLPEAEGLPASAIAELQELEIPLQAPLATRTLLSH